MAIILGIGQTTLGSIESGETKKIDFLLMDKICKEFNVDSDYFKDATKLKQINKDHAVGYMAENQTFNNPEKLMEKLLEALNETIKLLKSKN